MSDQLDWVSIEDELLDEIHRLSVTLGLSESRLEACQLYSQGFSKRIKELTEERALLFGIIEEAGEWCRMQYRTRDEELAASQQPDNWHREFMILSLILDRAKEQS